MTQEDNFTAAYEREAATRRKAVEINKAVVFDALAAANITSVTVEFDGEGDSGGIEYVATSRGDTRVELPTVSVPFRQAEGIFMAEAIFGRTITLSTGRAVPTRLIGEQHVREDLGFIPSFADWVKAIRPEPWMGRSRVRHAKKNGDGT